MSSSETSSTVSSTASHTTDGSPTWWDMAGTVGVLAALASSSSSATKAHVAPLPVQELTGRQWEDEAAELFRRRPPQFQDKLEILFGTTDTEEGDMLCVGGIGDRTPSNGSDDNTPVSDENIGRSSAGRSGQRSRREHVVDSPPAKRKKSMEYYVERLSESMLERSRNESSAKSRERDEIAELLRVVEADGVNQSSELYFIATDLFRTAAWRTAFQSFRSPDDRIAWLRWTWENAKKK